MRFSLCLLLPQCWAHQLWAKFLDVDGACYTVSKRLAVGNSGHAQQEVGVVCHSLTFHGTGIFLQLLFDFLFLAWPWGTWHVANLVGSSLTRLDEEHFGLPCQRGGRTTCEGQCQLSQGHLVFIRPIDTSHVSMGQYAYHLTSERDTLIWKLCCDFGIILIFSFNSLDLPRHRPARSSLSSVFLVHLGWLLQLGSCAPPFQSQGC